ncbi:hypothetical protein KFL_007590050 [Klebsormidium nitens]|uniref:CDAN1-interacting nuclease 1 n=1 Tax=Klebsormidium nitens TaxID=105231 RepID=A0A1Y1IPZ4_KLENI|nr:hypothetical protein KFL_007590050 [Klebsormidium nitens]|eukprot:GAQ91291.1 hypothetical protein KFL_007590050 [Klebsormidium nitens]
MKLALYEAIRAFVQRREDGRLEEAKKKFVGVSAETIYCIYAQDVQLRVRASHHRHRKKVDEYLIRYTQGQRLLAIADAIDLPPALLARLTIERVLGVTKQAVSALLKDPATIPSNTCTVEVSGPSGKDAHLEIDGARLQHEVRACVRADLVTAPDVDVARRKLGLEYEAKLYALLNDAGVAFETEDDLREAGFSKTPDARLLVPIGVRGRVVTWIDSKASFGDDYMHRQQAGEQFQGYVNRFGPGLVIYWFGFIDELQDEPSDVRFSHPDSSTLRPDAQNGDSDAGARSSDAGIRQSDADTRHPDGQPHPDVLLMDRFPDVAEIVQLPQLSVNPRP